LYTDVLCDHYNCKKQILAIPPFCIRASTYKKEQKIAVELDILKSKEYYNPKHRLKDNIEVNTEETDLKMHYRPLWFRIRFSASPETVTAGITTFSVARETLAG